jgi:hypothetical protein
MLLDVLQAWLSGKRGVFLPHGIIGMTAGQHFDQLEKEQPGALAALTMNDPALVDEQSQAEESSK